MLLYTQSARKQEIAFRLVSSSHQRCRGFLEKKNTPLIMKVPDFMYKKAVRYRHAGDKGGENV
jgi:hypothetical protein